MTSFVWIDGAEHGATLTTNGGGLCNTLSGSPTTSSSIKHSGNYSYRFNPSASQIYFEKTISTTTLVARIYIYFTTLPDTNNTYLFAGRGPSAYPVLYYTTTNGRFRVGLNGVAGNQEYGTNLATGQWYCIDLKFVTTGGTYTIDWYVNGNVQTQYSSSQTAATMTSVRVGSIGTNTSDIYFDDIMLSYTSGDYPISYTAIAGLSPDTDGTHVGGTNTMEDQGGTDIVSPTYTTAHDLVNSVPIGDATAYIKQSTNDTAKYAEVLFADTAYTSIGGAIALLAYKSSATQANEGACIIIDEDATQTTVYGNPTTRTDYSESSNFYKSVILPNPSGGWDQSAVNALKARVGYSNDTSPNPYWLDLIVQVAYTPDVTIALSKASITATGQSSTITPGEKSTALSKAALTATGQTTTVTLTTNISLNAATITATGQSLTVVQGEKSTALGTASTTTTGQSLTVTPGAISVALNKAEITSSGQSILVSQNVNLSTASITATENSITITPGAVSVALSAAGPTASGKSLSIVPGAVGVSLTTANVTSTGQPATITPGAVSVSLSVASITSTGQTITITAPSGGTIPLDQAEIVASGQTITITPGAVIISLNTASLIATGESLSVQPGAVSISLNAGLMTASGQSTLISSSTNISLSTASIVASENNLGVQPGAVTISLDTGLLLSTGQTITIFTPPSGIFVILSSGVLSASGKSALISAIYTAYQISLQDIANPSYTLSIGETTINTLGISDQKLNVSSGQDDMSPTTATSIDQQINAVTLSEI